MSASLFTQTKEMYVKTKKPIDNIWTAYITRPFAAFFVVLLQDSKITPNQVTFLSYFAALASVVLVVLPQLAQSHMALIAAALVFQFAYILDCVDGMLARARGIASPAGHLLDFLMDELKALAFFGAVSLRLYFATSNDLYLVFGVVGGVALSSGLSLTTFTRRPEIAPPSSAASTPPKKKSLVGRVVGLVESAAKFLIHYPSYLLYVALLNRIDIYFFAYMGVNTLYFARTFLSVFLTQGVRDSKRQQ